MSNIMAAIGIEQLKRFDILGGKRKQLAIQYTRLLDGVEDIALIDHNFDDIVPHIFAIRFKHQKQRDSIIKILKENNIQYGLHYKPNHLLSKYRVSYNLKNSELAYSQLLSLPLHPDIEISDVELICELIRKNINKVY